MAEINFIDYCKIFCSSGRGGQHYATGKSAEYIILDVFINLYRVGQGILQKE